MEYEYYLQDADNSEYVAVAIHEKYNLGIKKCRRCGKEFIPEDKSGTNAQSFRCKNCLTVYSLMEDVVYSCTIS